MINIHIETIKQLVSENGKRFNLFSDISFKIYNNETGNLDIVICKIIGMSESDYDENREFIIADNIEINGHKIDNPCIFYLKDMKDVGYVYYN